MKRDINVSGIDIAKRVLHGFPRNSSRGIGTLRIRPWCVRGLLSHNDNDPLQESGVSVSVACMPAPLFRVVCRRSRRYNAVSTGVAGVGDVTCPHIATKERRHEHALRR